MLDSGVKVFVVGVVQGLVNAPDVQEAHVVNGGVVILGDVIWWL